MNSLTKLCRWIIPCSDKHAAERDADTQTVNAANHVASIPTVSPSTPAALLSEEELQFILNLYK